MTEFRVLTSKKKKFTFHYKDGTRISYVGYHYWESPQYRSISPVLLQKITYTLDYKEDSTL